MIFDLIRKSDRARFILTAASCSCLLAFGYYLQFIEDLLPCPMCVLQRMCYLAIVVVSLIAGIHGSAALKNLYGLAIASLAAVGAAIAGRQVWLQHLPPALWPECGPGLDFMFQMYPFTEVILRTLRGTGDCAAVQWTFAKLSIAEWSLVWFLLIFTTYLSLMVLSARQKL